MLFITNDIIEATRKVVCRFFHTLGGAVCPRKSWQCTGHIKYSDQTNGSNIYYQDSDDDLIHMGDLRDFQTGSSTFTSNIDAAFVELRNGFWIYHDFYPSKTFMNNETYQTAHSNYVIIQNMGVHMYGATSGEQLGTVVSTSFSYTHASGDKYTDVVKSNYTRAGGDSGAGIAFWRYVGSASSVYDACGIHSGVYFDLWGNEFAIFSKIDNIMDEFNLSDY